MSNVHPSIKKQDNFSQSCISYRQNAPIIGAVLIVNRFREAKSLTMTILQLGGKWKIGLV